MIVKNHNKRSNTYASKRIVRELIQKKKAKTTSALVTSFFKPLKCDRETNIFNADTTINCSETACSENLSLSDSSCSENSTYESEPVASQVLTSESIETQWKCSDSDPKSSKSSNTPEILTYLLHGLTCVVPRVWGLH